MEKNNKKIHDGLTRFAPGGVSLLSDCSKVFPSTFCDVLILHAFVMTPPVVRLLKPIGNALKS